VDGTTLRRTLASLTLFCVGLACASVPAPPPPRQGGYRYVSTKLGVALELPSAWRGFERREDLPEALRDLIPAGSGPKPDMVAIRQGDQAFGRILHEPVSGLSTLAYFQLLLNAMQGRFEILGAAYSSERDTVRWRFRLKAGPLEFVFVETVAVRRKQAVRVAFWSPSALASYYASEFDSITAGALLFEESGAGWAASWQDLDASLDPASFPDLALAADREPDQAPECERPPQGLLWKVRTARGAMFLFPSFHLGHPDFFPLPAAVEEAFAASQRIVVEVDVRGSKLEEVMSGRAQASSARRGAELRPDQRAEVERRIATFGAPAKELVGAPPWAIAIVLEFLEWQSQGYYTEFGIERYFLDRSDGRKVIELESPEAQIEILEQNGAQMLDHTLRSLDQFASHLGPTVTAWYCGGPDGFSELLEGSGATPMPAELRTAVLDDRNRAMVERLERLLDEPGVTFVTVGLGHFLGPTGLPALLAAGGHAVEGP
jgi:uncharacterized protein YbaP (TraB family)